MTTLTCVTCGSPITVTTRNPNRRFCSPRCRVADWHAHHRRNVVANDANDVADAVRTRSDVPNAVPAATASPNAHTAATNWPSSPSSSPPTPPTSKHRR